MQTVCGKIKNKSTFDKKESKNHLEKIKCLSDITCNMTITIDFTH